MKKNAIKIFSLLFLSGATLLIGTNKAYADWYTRPDSRPTQPSLARPTLAPLPTETTVQPTAPSSPTAPPGDLSATPRVRAAPSSTPVPSSGGTNQDPCAEGKSFVGPYCGWSPRVGGDSGTATGSTGQGVIKTETKVKGFSYTSGWELLPSDIILLSGVLCLLLYARSKLNVRRQTG